jgi:hypothetical protein
MGLERFQLVGKQAAHDLVLSLFGLQLQPQL